MSNPNPNQTSFRPGHKRSQASIEKQRATMKRQFANGERPISPGKLKGTKDSHRDRYCDYCLARYTPTSSKQRFCEVCSDHGKWITPLRGHGLSKPDYDRMVEAQDGKCAICGKIPKRRLVIDHCHKTGVIRGLLCYSCNLKLSGLDDQEWRVKAEVYRNTFP